MNGAYITLPAVPLDHQHLIVVEIENKACLMHRYWTTGLSVLCAPGILFALRCICCHHDTRYAVDIQPGRFTRWKPDSPAAAWYSIIFFTKIWLEEPNFREKDPVFFLPCRRRKLLLGEQPHNVCHHDTRYALGVPGKPNEQYRTGR